MVFALIFIAGGLYLVAVVLDHLNRPNDASVKEMLAMMDAEKEAIHKANVAILVAQMQRDFDENIERLREEDRLAEERGYTDVDDDPKTAISEVTDALVGLGWQRSECKRLATTAVDALGPRAGVEDLVKYALTH